MNAVRGKNVLLVVLAAAVPLAYFAGGVSGFGKGYAAAQFSQSASAGPLVAVLRALRAGGTTTAFNMLEAQLDGLVVQNSIGRESFASLFNLPRRAGVYSAAVVDKSAGAALTYRTEYPSPTQGAVKQAVDAALVQLAKHVRE